MGMHRRLSPWLLPLLLIPTAAFANGVSPVLNFFHRETWAPASVVTLVIILVESVLLRWRVDVHGDTSYGIGYAQDQRFRRGLYMLNLDTGVTTRFADGADPSLAVGTGAILARDQGGLVLVGASGDPQVRIDAPRMSLVGAVVSPSGDMVLTEIPRRVPFHPGGRLVLFHTQAPEVRHVLCEGLSYRVDWTLGDDLRQ